MKNQIIKSLTLSATALFYCIGAQAANIEITFANMSTIDGDLYIAAYQSEQAFKQKQAIQSQIVSVLKEKQKAVLADLPAGEYSVMVFQDLDGDHKLNANMLGIPTEPYGFSTNPALMGPPSFNDIRFVVGDNDVALTINME